MLEPPKLAGALELAAGVLSVVLPVVLLVVPVAVPPVVALGT